MKVGSLKTIKLINNWPDKKKTTEISNTRKEKKRGHHYRPYRHKKDGKIIDNFMPIIR